MYTHRTEVSLEARGGCKRIGSRKRKEGTTAKQGVRPTKGLGHLNPVYGSLFSRMTEISGGRRGR